MKNMLSVREALKRAKEEGISVSEYTLRIWIKSGEIPHVVAGRNKILIFYPNLVHYVMCDGKTGDEEEGTFGEGPSLF